MKANFLTGTLLVLLGLNGAAQIPVFNQPSLDQSMNQVLLQSESAYSDLIARCRNYVSVLREALRDASDMRSDGNTLGAAAHLTNVLHNAAYEITHPRDGVLYPHTALAILASDDINLKVRAAILNSPLSIFTKGEVAYSLVTSYYKLILKAYDKLDQPFFWSAVQSCASNCDSKDLPREYKEGVGRLAKDFVEQQENLAKEEAYDKVELVAMESVSGAAKSILNNSRFRREYACSIEQFSTLQNKISVFMSEIHSDGEVARFTDRTRVRFNAIPVPLITAGPCR